MGRDGLADTRKWDEAVGRHAEMAAATELTRAINWIGRRKFAVTWCKNVAKRNSSSRSTNVKTTFEMKNNRTASIAR